MKFSTPVILGPDTVSIDYNANILLLGSCFAENMARQFDYYKFRHVANPFGILFHPLAIDEAIYRCLLGQKFDGADTFFSNGRWHSFHVHSDMSHPEQPIMLQNLEKQRQLMKKMLTEATHIIITYGTAWVYRDLVSKNVVANCHKVPATQFDKELLSIETIEAAITNTITSIQGVNPDVHIIFTISPVRHIKDGIVENQRSKAHLIAALHAVLESHRSDTVRYFPAYEIIMDELRDYRYYADDMIHPSSKAIEYIWQRFTESHMTGETHLVMAEVGKIQKAVAHRPSDPNSEAHNALMKVVGQQAASLTVRHPHMQF